MTNYTKTTDFAAKDSLPSGNAAKIVKGSEIDTEFNNIATASATKANANDAVLTGTTTAQTLDISGNVDVDGTLETDALSLNGVTVTSTAAELNYVDGVTSNIQTQLDAKAPTANPTFTGSFTSPGIDDNADAIAITIDSSENVGIGSTSPDALLRVNGTAKIGEGAASNTAKLMVNTASGVAAGIQLFQDGNESWIIQNPASTTALTFANSGTERIRIDSSGNVGIGTSSPGAKLSINDATAPKVRFTDTTDFYYTDYGRDGIDAYTNTNGSAPIFFKTGGSERMRVDSSGNVGIGTSSPASLLTIQDATPVFEIDSTTTSNTATIQFTSSGTVDSKITHVGNTGVMTIDSGRNSSWGGKIAFVTDTEERMRVDNSGNLLVGSTNNSNETDEGFKLKPNGEGTNKPRLSISTAGYQLETCLSIYSTAVTAFRFYVNAAGTISAVNTTISSLSDERVKENIRDLDDGLDKILQLQPRKFDWKEGQGRDISNDRGFIAQEFEQVFPDMIEGWKDKAPEGEEPYKAVNANLIPTLVKAIQEQQETITALEARITQLENG